MSNPDIIRPSNCPRQAFSKLTNQKSRISDVSVDSQDNGPEIVEHSPIKSQFLTMTDIRTCTECNGQDEYTKVLQEALKEVLDQNEALRLRTIELEAILSQKEDAIEEKDDLIQQLQRALFQIKSSNPKLC